MQHPLPLGIYSYARPYAARARGQWTMDRLLEEAGGIIPARLKSWHSILMYPTGHA
jgi:hypothetical protein